MLNTVSWIERNREREREEGEKRCGTENRRSIFVYECSPDFFTAVCKCIYGTYSENTQKCDDGRGLCKQSSTKRCQTVISDRQICVYYIHRSMLDSGKLGVIGFRRLVDHITWCTCLICVTQEHSQSAPFWSFWSERKMKMTMCRMCCSIVAALLEWSRRWGGVHVLQ